MRKSTILLTTFSCLLLEARSSLGAEEQAVLYPPMTPPFTDIVREGKAQCVIVPGAETGKAGQWAAEQVQSCLQKMSDAEVPIEKAPTGGAFPIRIMRDSSLAEEELRIRCDGKEVALAGGGDRGVIYAACAFLEECLGVRWFMPTDFGTVAPRTRTIQVGRFDRAEKPDFALRWIGNGDWAACNRMNVGIPEAEVKVALPGHTFDRVIPPDKYFKDHPDWFAYHREKKTRRPTQLCTSNPELVQEVIKNMRAVLDADAGIRIIGLCPNDGSGFCECDECMKLDEPGRPSVVEINKRYVQLEEERCTALGRRFLIFYNEVAKALRQTHPKVIVRSFAYNAYLAPPTDAKLQCEPNLMIQICHNTCHNHPFGAGDCPVNVSFRKYIDGWGRICEHVGFYEYYSKGAAMGLPWPMVHCIRADIPFLRQHEGWGFYTQWSRADVASAGLDFYVAAKLLWNARLNVDALLDDFFAKFYGPAAEPMKRIYDRLEQAAARSKLHAKGSSDCKYIFVGEWFSPKILDPCFADLEEACKRTTDEEILRRIAVQEAVLTYARLMCRYQEELARLHRAGAFAQEKSLEEAKQRATAVENFVKSKAKEALTLDKYTKAYLNPAGALRRMSAPAANPW
jgi:hypothetical protein